MSVGVEVDRLGPPQSGRGDRLGWDADAEGPVGLDGVAVPGLRGLGGAATVEPAHDGSSHAGERERATQGCSPAARFTLGRRAPPMHASPARRLWTTPVWPAPVDATTLPRPAPWTRPLPVEDQERTLVWLLGDGAPPAGGRVARSCCPPMWVREQGVGVMMTIHRLSAGDGYRYLTRTTARADVDHGAWESAGTPLTAYYTATGTPPGRWAGHRAGRTGRRAWGVGGVGGGRAGDGRVVRHRPRPGHERPVGAGVPDVHHARAAGRGPPVPVAAVVDP